MKQMWKPGIKQEVDGIYLTNLQIEHAKEQKGFNPAQIQRQA